MKQMKNHILTVILFLTGSICFAQDNQSVSGQIAGHDYVDLGLPSGTLWATCNVGATKPTEYGDYFAWDEIEPKEVYNWSSYKYGVGPSYGLDTLKKYNFGNYGYPGTIDGLSILLPEDDAATANWGEEWRIPTNEEQRELKENSYMVWTDGYNGTAVRGVIFYKAKSADDKGIYVESKQTLFADYSISSDAHVFLPAGGRRWGDELYGLEKVGFYWSSSLYEETERYAFFLDFSEEEVNVDYDTRSYGYIVRAVANGNLTSASTISNPALQVYADKGIIHIANAQAKTNIQVIDVNGKTVASGITDANGSAEIRLSVLKGVYVVSDGNQSTKLVIQ